MSVLILNDVRYDKLDPCGRVFAAAVEALRRPQSMCGAHYAQMFAFACVVLRSRSYAKASASSPPRSSSSSPSKTQTTVSTILTLADLIGFLQSGGIECADEANADLTLDALHYALAESVTRGGGSGGIARIDERLVVALTAEHRLLDLRPAACVELWTMLLHFAVSEQISFCESGLKQYKTKLHLQVLPFVRRPNSAAPRLDIGCRFSAFK